MKNKILITVVSFFVFAVFSALVFAYETDAEKTVSFTRNLSNQAAPTSAKSSLAAGGGLLEYSLSGKEPIGLVDPKNQKSASAPIPISAVVLPTPQVPSGNIIYVDASAPAGGNGTQSNPFQTITQGIAAVCQNGDIVQVMPGTYTEYLDISWQKYYHQNYSFTLRGDPNNPSSTVIVGYLAMSMPWGSNCSFVLDGVTRQGDASVSSDENLSVTIQNVIFENIAGSFAFEVVSFIGYQLHNTSYTAPVLLQDVIIKNNLLSGCAMRLQSCNNVTLVRTKIVNNQKTPSASEGGGAMAIYDSQVNIDNALIAFNQGNSSCGFQSRGGGVTAMTSTLTITNSVIANNVNTTTGLSVNAAPGLDLSSTNAFILNSIIWDNTYLHFLDLHKQISISSFGQPNVSIAYSDIQYGIDGITPSPYLHWLTGNIGQNLVVDNPQFVNVNDWDNDGFSLQNTSPCAGIGINTFVFPDGPTVSAPTVDINNSPRPIPVGTQPDMGAYEINQDATIYYVAVNGSNSNDGLTPETAFATIAYALSVVTDGDIIQVLPGTHSGNLGDSYSGNPISVSII